MPDKITFKKQYAGTITMILPGLYISSSSGVIVFAIKKLDDKVLGEDAFLGFVVDGGSSGNKPGEVSTFYTKYFVPIKGTFTYSNED